MIEYITRVLTASLIRVKRVRMNRVSEMCTSGIYEYTLSYLLGMPPGFHVKDS